MTLTWIDDCGPTRFWHESDDPGYYVLAVQCTATLHDSTTGLAIGSPLITYGYVGGSASDIGDGGGASGNARQAAGRGGQAGASGMLVKVHPCALIFYGNNASKKDGNRQYFYRGALQYKSEYLDAHPGHSAFIISLVGGPPSQIFSNALSLHRNIDTIIYIGHAAITSSSGNNANPIGSFISVLCCDVKQQDIYTSDVAAFPTENVMPNPTIWIYGCDSAAVVDHEPPYYVVSPSELTIAEAFAQRFVSPVQGFVEHVSFGAVGQSYYHVNYDLFHLGREAIYPVTVYPSKPVTVPPGTYNP